MWQTDGYAKGGNEKAEDGKGEVYMENREDKKMKNILYYLLSHWRGYSDIKCYFFLIHNMKS